MITPPPTPLPAGFRRSAQRAWYLAPVGFIALSIAVQQPIFLLLALIPLLVIVMAEVWSFAGLRRLTITQRLSKQRAFCGDTIYLELRVTNAKRLPLPWLYLRSEIPTALVPLTGNPGPGTYASHQQLGTPFVLAAHQTVARRRPLYCRRRGLYRIITATVECSDPLGWYRRQQALTLPMQEIVIYPQVVPLDTLNMSVRAPFGDVPTARRMLEDPLQLAGVRAYMPGDDRRRINWKATARLAQLQSNVFTFSGQHQLVAVLDLYRYGSRRGVDDEQQFEFNISVAASIAQWALERSYAFGLLTNGRYSAEGVATQEESLWLAPSNQFRQREYVFEALARLATMEQRSDIQALIARYRAVLTPGTTVLLLTMAHALHARTVDYLLTLRKQGIGVFLVLTGRLDEEPSAATYDLPVYRLEGKESIDDRDDAADNATTHTQPASVAPAH